MQQATSSARGRWGSDQAVRRLRAISAMAFLVGVSLGLSGCWAPSSARSGAAEVANPVTIDAREYDRIYRAAELTLREQGYVLDWQGYRFGRLVTLPRATPTLFEPWHHGNQSPYPTLSATLHQERHRITVFLDPQPASSTPPAALPDYLWRVEVMIERAQQPQRRLAGSTDGDSVWSNLADAPSELKERGIHGAYWMAMGRDMDMEQRLIAAILRRSVLLTDREMTPAPAIESDTSVSAVSDSSDVASPSPDESSAAPSPPSLGKE